MPDKKMNLMLGWLHEAWERVPEDKRKAVVFAVTDAVLSTSWTRDDKKDDREEIVVKEVKKDD